MIYNRADTEKLNWIFKQEIFKLRGMDKRMQEYLENQAREKEEVLAKMEEIIKERGLEITNEFTTWFDNYKRS